MGGADSSRRLLSGWLEAADGAEAQPLCSSSSHPCWALRPQHSSLSRGGESIFVGERAMHNSNLRLTLQSRRNFLAQLSAGVSGGLLAGVSGAPSLFGLQRSADADSLKIVKVDPHLLTGVRGYAPWLFVRVETADGIVGWGEGTNFPGVQPIATAI